MSLQAEEVFLKVGVIVIGEQNDLLHHPVLFPEESRGWQLSAHLVLFKDPFFLPLK